MAKNQAAKFPSAEDLSFIDSDIEAVGGGPVPAELLRLQTIGFPEVTHDLDGTWHMEPAEASALNDSLAAFGLALRTDNAPLHALQRADYVCQLGLLRLAIEVHRWPKRWRSRVTKDGLPADWVDYIEAIAALDRERARALAVRLEVLDPQTTYPERFLGLHAKKAAEIWPFGQ